MILPENPNSAMQIKIIRGSTQFTHLRVVGHCAAMVPLPAERSTTHRLSDTLFFEMLPLNMREDFAPLIGDYYACKGDVRSTDISIRKMDFTRCKDYKENPFWKRAVDYVYSQIHDIFKVGISPAEEFITDMDFSTASGLPWTLLGLKKKSEVMENPETLNYVIHPDYALRMGTPYWRVSPKAEWMSKKDLDSGKVRTFIIPPIHFLWWQKVLYSRQNKALKSRFWSAYGFNPYQGGTHSMAIELTKNKHFFSYDVKGWDRLFTLMAKIYRMRNFKMPWHLADIVKWVTENSINSYLVIPSGDIVYKCIGNNSGSGNTTCDNILGHFLMAALVVFNYYNGDLDLINQVKMFVFGDDMIGSLPVVYPHRSFEQCCRDVFKLFGYTLDPFLLSDNLADHSFLGFQFVYIGTHWIPRYSVGRLAASFAHSIERQKVDAQVAKMWSLTVMSAGNGKEVFDQFRSCTKYILKHLPDGENTVVDSFKAVGVPKYERVLQFYCGLETYGGTEEEKLFSNVSKQAQEENCDHH